MASNGSWDGIVELATAAKDLAIEIAKRVGEAVGISALPLQVVRHDDSLAHAGTAFAKKAVSESVRVKTGAAVKSAAKAGAVASKLPLMGKVAAACGKVAAASSIAVGTAVWATGFVIAFVGVVWLVKRAIKRLGDFIEVFSAVGDAEKTGEELLAVAAA